MSVLVVQEGHVVTAGGAQTHRIVNTYAYRSPNATGPSFVPPMLTAFKQDVGDRVCDRLHTDYVSDRLFVWLKCNSLGVAIDPGVPCQNGQIGGGRLPLSQCVNLLPRTPLRGRSFYGVKKFGPIPAASVVGDELAGFEILAWHFVAGQIRSGFTASDGANWLPCVFSRALSVRTIFTFTPFLTDISTVDTNLTIGVARHRRERTVL